MITNYKVDKYGIIHQIEKMPRVYNNEYVKAYINIPEVVLNMSYLRLGYIYSSIPNFTTLLDVGFGSGTFLTLVRDCGKKCSGYDVFNNENLPKDVQFVDNFNNHYDVITFFDSLEHFDSIDFVKDLQCKYVVISVPWCHYISDKWFEEWKHRRPTEHFHHFNDKSLISFMEDNNYSLVTYSNVEDVIRKSSSSLPNILTAIFKKNNND